MILNQIPYQNLKMLSYLDMYMPIENKYMTTTRHTYYLSIKNSLL